MIDLVTNFTWLSDLSLINSIEQLMFRGGPVLWWLAVVMLFFWVLVLDRVLYLVWVFPQYQQQWVLQWQGRTDRHSWFALSQRESWLAQSELALKRWLSLMKVLISLFPMLGLLGTVTGMISVFDVMAAQGNSEPRLMAAGISMATIPTMAGMVAALVSMFVYSRLCEMADRKQLHLERLLRIHTQ
ncbi:MotA/TolQ/ExbB proton channel family protein [Vibrio rarus]|uniref:MotA/TolQ/ExbB proton channel family protein n=1 Tax=Vibrio rarus TaxID=413403 RepID=UPI0021C3487F|nr:MotA/TolQ/ExbB proton channel family protein [Vibrio rarus]